MTYRIFAGGGLDLARFLCGIPQRGTASGLGIRQAADVIPPSRCGVSIVARRSRLRPSAAYHILGTILLWGSVLGHRQAKKGK